MKRWFGIAIFLVVPSVLGQPPAHTDSAGDPLPPGALLRIGTIRWRTATSWNARSALSSDGKFLFVDEADGGIRIFDMDTGLSRRSFSDNAHHVWALAISPDGKRLASAGYHDGGKFKAIVWDVVNGKQLCSLEIGAKGARVVAFSHDGKKLIAGDPRDARKLCVIDIASGAEELSLAIGDITLVFCNADGKTLITGGGRYLHVWDITNGTLIRWIDGKGDADTQLGVSRDGGTIAMIGPYGPDKRRTLRLIDAASGMESKIVTDFPGNHVPPAFSPDGKYLAVADFNNLRVWDLAGEKEKWLIPARETMAFHFTPDSHRLISVGSVVRVWDVERRKELHPTKGPYIPATKIAYAPDGNTLATSAHWDRETVELFDTTSGSLKAELNAGPHFADEIDFASDGRLVCSRWNAGQVWDTSTCKKLMDLEGPKRERVYSSGIRIAPDGRTLGVAAVEWSDFDAESGPPVYVFKWELANGKLIAGRKRIGGSFRIPKLTLDGMSVLVEKSSGLSLVDAVTGKQKFKFQSDLVMPYLPCGTTPGEISCTFSPDGRFVALSDMIVAGSDKQLDLAPMALRSYLGLFDLSTGKEMQRIPASDFRSLCAFSPDCKRFVTADGPRLCFWAAATGKRVWESPILDHRVTALAFNPSGNRLATALKDSTILIWDVNSMK